MGTAVACENSEPERKKKDILKNISGIYIEIS